MLVAIIVGLAMTEFRHVLATKQTSIPLIPIAVLGSRESRIGRFWRRDILLRVGEPFHVSELDADPKDAQAVADAMMRRVAALLPAAMRGVYA